MTERTRASWVVYALGALCLGAIVAAVLVVGPASGNTATVTRTATVAEGVVQSTVSGSGNLQPASQLNLGFKTSGTVTHIYVTQGQHVASGQLIATLDPQSAEVTLEQSKATLQAAEANLAKEEETDGEGSSGAGSNASASTGSAGAVATTASSTPTTTTAPQEQQPTQTPTTSTGPTQTTTTKTTSTPAAPTTTTKSSGEGHSSGESKSNESGESKSSSSSSTSTTSTISAATREANIASARAAVKSDALTVQSDEQAVENTRLYAPESGTIASLDGQVGEDVSASGTTRASSSSSSSSGSSGAGTSSAGAAGARASTTGASTSSTSSTGSSSSAFAVLTDLSSMQLVVPLSESEVGDVHEGQIATITVEALSGKKLAAHVSEVAILSTSNSGVVSYDVTFVLDQMDAGLKPGMSASAEVVVNQAEGVNVPTSAITASTVTVVRGGKHVRQRVVTGLAGNSTTIILSGLKAGETIVLPSTSTTSTSSRGSSSSRLGGGGLGGLPGAGAGAFFRGGG